MRSLIRTARGMRNCDLECRTLGAFVAVAVGALDVVFVGLAGVLVGFRVVGGGCATGFAVLTGCLGGTAVGRFGGGVGLLGAGLTGVLVAVCTGLRIIVFGCADLRMVVFGCVGLRIVVLTGLGFGRGFDLGALRALRASNVRSWASLSARVAFTASCHRTNASADVARTR